MKSAGEVEEAGNSGGLSSLQAAVGAAPSENLPGYPAMPAVAL